MPFPSKAAILGIICLATGFSAQAQTLEVQPTPFTALLDFALLQHPAVKMAGIQSGLPIWLETVQIVHSDPKETPQHTTFRIRLRQMPGLSDSILLRLFFDDRPGMHPVITAWSETGDKKYVSPPLGAGLDLAASESVAISTVGVDYLEIDVPGDGSSVRQALLATLRKNEVASAIDFQPAQPSSKPLDPFDAPSPATPLTNDLFLFGRVRATLEPGPVKLMPLGSGKGSGKRSSPETPSVTAAPSGAANSEAESGTLNFEFNLDGEPLLALVTFDILDADPAAPLMAWVNGEPAGAVAFQLPDLADPAYMGITRPLEKMRFHYAGWVRCQKIIPGALLRRGENTFTLQLPANANAVAIRAVELQLKNHWLKLDYTLSP